MKLVELSERALDRLRDRIDTRAAAAPRSTTRRSPSTTTES
jgi:hypothetical protein